jgi:hypothetical protein
MKIRPVGAEMFHADRQTDKMKLKSIFAVLQMCPESIIKRRRSVALSHDSTQIAQNRDVISNFASGI